MNQITQSVEPRTTPYFGLDYYEEKFGAWFFGRETEASKITNNLRAARLTLLHAESGVGKSSLLRAGVAWRMRRLADDSFARRGMVRYVPIVFISWKDNPVQELVGTIRSAIRPYLGDEPEPELPADRLDVAIGAAAEAVNANLLIMLDQFEEYFLYRSREPVSEQFADELARCINRTDLRANFLIAIREDAYAGLGDLFKGRIANVYGNFLHIDYLDRAAAEEAIRKPLDVYNSQPSVSEPVGIEDELVDAVLAQVRAFGDGGDTRQDRAAANGGGSGRVSTPLLQLVMDSVWEQEDIATTHELRYSTLQNLHGVEMIVDTHLNQALDALGRAERQTAIDTFDHLVTPSGGKIAQSVFDLAGRTGHSEDQVGGVLEKLDDERIVRPIPAAPGKDRVRFRRYEIFHDVLGPSINRAIAVAHEVQRRRRRVRRITSVAGGVAIVVLAVILGFAWALRSANAAKTTAEWDQVGATAEYDLLHNPELSAQLAVQALLHGRDTGQAEDVLRAALPQLQTEKTLPDGATVFSAVFDPVDPNLVASADNNGVAWIWDVKTGRHPIRMWLGGYDDTGSADAAAFNPTGTAVAVGFADGSVAVFDARTGKIEGQSAQLCGSVSSPVVNSLEFVGDTGELAIATQEGAALWQRQNGSRCYNKFSSGPARAVGADPANSREFAVATDTGAVIWTVTSSGKPQQQQPLGQQGLVVNDAEFNRYGTRVVTADADGNVNVYDFPTLKAMMTLDAGEADASSAAFVPDGAQQIVAGYASGRVRVWDTSSRLQLTLLQGNAGFVEEARFNADGSEVVTASSDGTIRVWNPQPRELQHEFVDSSPGGGPAAVGLVAYLSDGRVASLDYRGHLYVSTTGGTQQTVMYPGGSAIVALSWNRAGTELVSAQANKTVDLWRATGTTFTQVALPSRIVLSGGPAQDVEMTADGSRLLIVNSDDYTIQVLSARTGQPVEASLSATNAVFIGAFSPSGQILTGDDNGQVEVWSAAGRHSVLGKPGPAIDDIESNRSGSQFVTTSFGGTVTVWATSDDRPLRSISACASPNTASFSPDGTKIVVACGDGTVRVFDAATLQMLVSLQATSAGNVSYAAFSPDGKYIVTAVYAGNTGCVQIWSSELATTSVQALERIAEQSLPSELTPAQLQGYLTDTSG
jgi:WD40 repeat protein